MFRALTTRERTRSGQEVRVLEARDVVYRLAVADESESDAAHLEVSLRGMLRLERERSARGQKEVWKFSR